MDDRKIYVKYMVDEERYEHMMEDIAADHEPDYTEEEAEND